jgi:hypothetical protein
MNSEDYEYEGTHWSDYDDEDDDDDSDDDED